MTFLLFLMVLLVIFAIVFVVVGVKVVQQAETVVVERLGKYYKTLTGGINIILPLVDRPREIEWRYVESAANGQTIIIRKRVARIDLRESVYDFPKQNVITKDNVVIEINAILYMQVVDPVKVVYEIANLPDAIEKLTQTTLRNIIGEMDLDETLASRDTVNSKLRLILDDATEKWGVKINRVELQDIVPPTDIKQAMEKQMRAERDRRAIILEAEGEKQSAILKSEGTKEAAINRALGEKESSILLAEGQAQAKIRIAEADAEAIALITKTITQSGGNPSNYLVAMRYIDTMKEMVSGKDNKVVLLPYEATGVLGALGGIKEMFQENKK